MTSAKAVTDAIGYLAQNWPALNDSARPAIIVNPAAQPLDVLSWCWGEVQSLSAAASVISMGANGCDAGDFDAIFAHRLEPLVRVMSGAMDELAKQASAGASQPGGAA